MREEMQNEQKKVTNNEMENEKKRREIRQESGEEDMLL